MIHGRYAITLCWIGNLVYIVKELGLNLGLLFSISINSRSGLNPSLRYKTERSTQECCHLKLDQICPKIVRDFRTCRGMTGQTLTIEFKNRVFFHRKPFSIFNNLARYENFLITLNSISMLDYSNFDSSYRLASLWKSTLSRISHCRDSGYSSLIIFWIIFFSCFVEVLITTWKGSLWKIFIRTWVLIRSG